MTSSLSFYNLLIYDYIENFFAVSEHAVNLYSSTKISTTIFFSTNVAIKDYIQVNVSREIINLSISFYDSKFRDTIDMKHSHHNESANFFEFEIWDYQVLSQSNVVIKLNKTTNASYIWDKIKQRIVNFDTMKISNAKIQYLKDQELDEAFFWHVVANRIDCESLIMNVNKISHCKMFWKLMLKLVL